MNEEPSALCLLGPFVSCQLKPRRDVLHSTDMPVVEPGINAKTCQLNFSKSLPFCLTSSRQNAARTVSNLVSGRAGEKALLSNEFIIVSLHPSAALGAADFNCTFLKAQTQVQGPRRLFLCNPVCQAGTPGSMQSLQL